MCAFTDIYECEPVKGCKRVSHDFANLAPVLKFDFYKNVMHSDDFGSEPREVEMKNIEQKGDIVLLHGIGVNEESPRSYSAAISTKTGHGAWLVASASRHKPGSQSVTDR